MNNGGVLILSARSGFKNEDNLATQLPPGPLERMAGVWVRSFTLLEQSSQKPWLDFPADQAAYRPSPDNLIQSASAEWTGEYQAKGWADILEPDGATPLFHYQKDYYAGKAAVTIANYGKGKVIYVGTLLEPGFYVDLARRACGWGKVDLGPELPQGMDYALRQNDKGSFRFLLNFSDTPKIVKLAGQHRDLISATLFQDEVTVPPLDLRVLVANRSKTSDAL